MSDIDRFVVDSKQCLFFVFAQDAGGGFGYEADVFEEGAFAQCSLVVDARQLRHFIQEMDQRQR
jgi:hypothetical protein